jgi:alanine dehydrogenase
VVTLLLSNEEIEQLLAMELCLDALRAMYTEVGKGVALSGPRIDLVAGTTTRDGRPADYGLKAMGGILPDREVAAVRIDSDIITWPTREGSVRREKVPAADGRWVGIVLLFSTRTGEPLLLCPDGYIQRTRVAAASALGADHLARADARVVALLGSGWQAEGQVEALCAVRPIDEIRVYSPDRSHREAFAARMAARTGKRIVAVDTADTAVAGADIIAAATNSLDPILRPEWMRPGVHLCAITVNEVDEEIVQEADRVAFHTRDYAKELTFRPAAADPTPQMRRGWWSDADAPFWSRVEDLGALAAGRALGRQGDDEITLFVNNIGMGLQFAAVGALVYQLARERGIGREIPTQWLTQTVHP